MLKKSILIFVLVTFLFAGAVQADDHVLKVGATPVPHAEILEFIKDDLAAEGIELDIVEFTDYVTPNLALDDGSIDANYFQHIPYLNQFNSDRDLNLKSVIKVHIEPIALYSEEYTNLEEIPEGASIAVPNDPSNEGRALLLLHNKGIITLDDPTNLSATPIDIIENPKNLKFEELEAAQLPRVLPDVAAAVINTNYALEADLNPLEDALIIEGSDSPYVNVVAVKAENVDSEKIKILRRVINSKKVKEFIIEEYEGAVVPAFVPVDSEKLKGTKKSGDYIF
ncbi:D-methionine transport system substrate-binding protein [Halanaerobium congolense]|jgi:D-methionine transport system substrate-binding protein|uniref:Lipoprotein n=1 Tax=Halanaerobium congolense TaxID=54121 RepID=A0A1G6LF23_9FIRM|nr:MetQ/NlpA family ABC transporter substrate-binding protein [Halanaerobium congolense]OEG63351.1 MAG: methionine ABC transporter substrate-binding protein [Halanaerobium sp. MDAL1]PTX15713.1 D-methionine transport system substrate-binding protein [Halanaerobium congolense]PXV68655.1 D-methionine transport system substrate-binding protein [Halanaerobium congolense]TDP18351.1 D-methionine transport system substrate-binding protein [Halanaerobium congolense]TDX39403.1 D-methionine transport sys